jgi:hypothetical protein
MSGSPEVVMSGAVRNASHSILTETKKCTRCGEIKKFDEFSKKTTHKDGLSSECKKCRKDSTGKHYILNREKILERNKQWYKNHPEHVRIKSKKRRIRHPEKVRASDRINYERHKERRIKYACEWPKSHPERAKENRTRWAKNNKDKIREKNQRARSTPMGKINDSISSTMRSVLRGTKAGRHWEDLVGYTVKDLKEHLEKQFKPGMSWSNHGQWHIDHKIPKAAFNFEKPEDIDFKKCWALSNLQPLWAIENTVKKDKLDRPFQPSLCIEV